MKNYEMLLIYTACFIIVFIITGITKKNRSNRLFDTEGFPAANKGSLMGLHLAGILWFGLIPLTLFQGSFKLILLGDKAPAILWLIVFAFIWLLLAFTGFKSSRQIHIKQNDSYTLAKTFLTQYFPVRILFLFSYELFFRGLLLFECIKWFGILPAIIISTGLTVLIHVFTNKKEMWGCIPFGIVLCGCSLAVNAVWPAVVFHITLSLAYELPSVNQFLTSLKPAK